MDKRTLIINLCIVLLSSALFMTGLGSSRLFDWDEINFAESAREMVTSGDWFNVQINYRSFWEKPPLFIWMQALSMKVFGVGEFAARFPNSLMGVLTLLLLFNLGRKAKDERFGLLWMGMYLISFLPFFYFKSGIIDPWFNFFIFLGIYFFSRYTDPAHKDKRMLSAILSAAAIGLGILTKGPVALLVFGLSFVVWLCMVRFKMDFRWKDVAAWVLTLCLVGGSWFIALALSGNTQVISDFITYQIRLFETKDAGHGGFPLYHFVILLAGVVPASIFALRTFRFKILRSEQDISMANLFRWQMVSFWVVLILFSIVRTKIVHYSSFCYFPLTFLGAWCADKMLDGKMQWKRWQSAMLIFFASLYGLILTALTLFDRFKEQIIPYVQDPFAVSCMEASSEWMGFEPLLGSFLIIMTVWFCVAFRKRAAMKHFLILAVGNISFMMVTLLTAVSEIEKYSQASAVEFLISKKGEDCYIVPFNYKSYAQYFYSDRQPQNTCDDLEYLSHGELDKKCYFMLQDRPWDIESFTSSVPDAQLLYKRSGFLFFVREKCGDKPQGAAEAEQKAEIE